MAFPDFTKLCAEHIYNYMGSDELPKFNDLAPTVQISYIEEASSLLTLVADYMRFCASIIPDQEQGNTLIAFASHIDPTHVDNSMFID